MFPLEAIVAVDLARAVSAHVGETYEEVLAMAKNIARDDGVSIVEALEKWLALYTGAFVMKCCPSPPRLLGKLGRLYYYRCRVCGGGLSSERANLDQETE